MKKLLTILFFSLSACFAKEEVMRVGVAMGLPPMAYMEKGEVVGVEIDLLNEFSKENKVDYKIVNLDFDKLIPALEKGEIDVIMASMSYTSERAKKIDFTETYATISQMPLVHKENVMKYQDALMLMNTIDNVCVIKDYTGEKLVKDNFKFCKVTTTQTTEEALDKLLKKQVDLLICDSVLVMWLSSNFKEQGLIALPILLRQESMCWAVKKGNKDLLAKLNNFISTHKKDGKIDNIIRQKIPYYDSKVLKKN